MTRALLNWKKKSPILSFRCPQNPDQVYANCAAGHPGRESNLARTEIVSGCSRPARSGRCIAPRRGPRHFFCNAAQSFGKEWETVCVSGLPRTKTTNPKQEKKSYYEKRKKYPELHRRRTLHPRDLSDFVCGRARTDVPWHAYGWHFLLRRQSRSRLHGHRQLEREHRSRDAGPGHAQRLLRWQPSLGVRVQCVDAGLVVRRRLRVRGVRRRSDGDARYKCDSGDVFLARRTRRRLPAPASIRLANLLWTS